MILIYNYYNYIYINQLNTMFDEDSDLIKQDIDLE